MRLVFLILFSIFYGSHAGTFTVDYTNHQFLKDGKPFRYLSGSIHYMRVHPGLWNDRLQRIRALGLNAIQIYVPWNLHEPTPGNFDFSGAQNISQFLSLAQQNGLYVLFRPGPYICAEWENGGLPYWLLKYDNINLRSSDANYTKAVQNYYNVLLDVIQPYLYKNGGPILMVQVENEYGGIGACDHNYTSWLRDLIWSKLGNDVQLYTTNPPNDHSFKCGAVNGTLTTIDFGIQSNDSTINTLIARQDQYSGGAPHVVSEYWVTWFNAWNNHGTPHGNTNFIASNLQRMYSLNASINIYMIHGGTNFGFMNGAEKRETESITTSYDYGAAISENGDINNIYHTIYNFIQNITDWPQNQLAIPSNNPMANYGQVTLKRIGTNLISTLTQIQEPCQQGQDPINFEQLDHAYGYVLYTTTLANGGKLLSTPNIADYGYVFVNNVYQNPSGIVVGHNGTSSITINAQAGDTLRILVEERGRINYWTSTYPYLDRKGLHTNVTLDGVPLKNWYSCGINLTKTAIDSLANGVINAPESLDFPIKASTAPGVYVGQFNASQLQDTFFDSTGWGKGQLFINGYNLGRYWPLAGPQITLYVPKPYIQEVNTVVLIELVGAQQNYINFVDHAIYH